LASTGGGEGVDPSKAFTSASVSSSGVKFSFPKKDSIDVFRRQVENRGLVEKRYLESVVSKPIESQPTM
jgi:hypothetical protein